MPVIVGGKRGPVTAVDDHLTAGMVSVGVDHRPPGADVRLEPAPGPSGRTSLPTEEAAEVEEITDKLFAALASY